MWQTNGRWRGFHAFRFWETYFGMRIWSSLWASSHPIEYSNDMLVLVFEYRVQFLERFFLFPNSIWHTICHKFAESSLRKKFHYQNLYVQFCEMRDQNQNRIKNELWSCSNFIFNVPKFTSVLYFWLDRQKSGRRQKEVANACFSARFISLSLWIYQHFLSCFSYLLHSITAVKNIDALARTKFNSHVDIIDDVVEHQNWLQ